MYRLVSCCMCFLIGASVVLGFHYSCNGGTCGPGEFQNKDGRCLPCPNGTTMELPYNHSCVSCFACFRPKPTQIVVEKCTATTNTVLGCPPMTFQDGPDSDFTCEPCRRCEIELSPCQGTKNTVCGPRQTNPTDGPITSTDVAASTTVVIESKDSKVSTTEGMETGTESTMELERPTPHYEIKGAQDEENDDRTGINLEVETAGNDNKIVIYIVVPVAIIGFLILVVGVSYYCLSKRGTYRLPICSTSESGGHGTNGPNDGSDIPLQTIATSS